MPLQLRWYQNRTVNDVLRLFQEGARGVIIQGPCGSGKTEIAMDLMSRLDGRWVLAVPNSVLASQSEYRLQSVLDAERFGSVNPNPPRARIQVATIQTLLCRDTSRQLQPDFICFDEAHHYEAEYWSMFAERYPNARRVGLTATPERADGKSLLRHFDQIVVAATYEELRSERLLVPVRLYAPTVPVPEGLAVDPITAWKGLAEGKRTIAAFGLVEEARYWSARFEAELGPLGYHAACVSGEDRRSYNEAILRDFMEGRIHFLTNVYYVAEGYDDPDVGCVIYGRRFQFRGTYVQFGGRGLRAAPEKPDCIAIDLTGCSYAHGVPDSDSPWILDEQDKPGRQGLEGDGEEPDGEETHLREPLSVSGEGLVRVCHGALPHDAPDPALTLCQENDACPDHEVQERVEIDRRARRMSGRSGVTAARYWAERELRRCGRLMRRSSS